MRVNDEQFREARHLRRRRMHVQLAEHPADRDLYGGWNLRLFLEEEHAELQERRVDLAEALLVEAVGQVDAAHFAAKRGRKRCHPNPPADDRLGCADALQQRIPPEAAVFLHGSEVIALHSDVHPRIKTAIIASR